jgi:hypothetical protein
MDARVEPAHDTGCAAGARHRPCSLRRGVRHRLPDAGLVRHPAFDRPPRMRTEGARDAKGRNGPAGLDASRHRGVSKSELPQVRQNPRRPARGVLRFAPQRPRWTSISGFLHYWRAPNHRLRPAAWAGRDVRGLDRRALVPHLRHQVHSPATAPRPLSEMLQTPLGNEAGCCRYIFL